MERNVRTNYRCPTQALKLGSQSCCACQKVRTLEVENVKWTPDVLRRIFLHKRQTQEIQRP